MVSSHRFRAVYSYLVRVRAVTKNITGVYFIIVAVTYLTVGHFMKSTRSMYTSMFPWLRCCGEDSQGKTVTSDHTDDDVIFMKQTTHNRNMDNRFRGEKMCGVLKTEQDKPLPLRQQWGSVESDTESLAQEKAYQQQLHNGRRDDHIKYIRFPKDSMDSLQLGYEDDEDSNDDATEDLQVYDSLEVTAHSHAKSSPALLQGEYLATQIHERERTTSKLLSDDAYSDLRYDPNWRTKLKGADQLSDGPQISIDEQYQVPEEKSSKAFADRQRLLIKGGYRYVVDTGPPVVSPYVTGNESGQPYCLLQEDSHTSSVTSPHCHHQALLHSPPEADLSRPSTIFTKHQSNNKCENIWYNDGEDIRRSSELLTEKINAMCIQELKTYHQQELRRTADGPTPLSTSALISPKVLSNRNLERPTDDIVERNKKTLGRNTSKYGSYATVHALKQERPHNVNKVHESPKEAASTESQEDSSDPMLRCLQETPHLTEPQVTQISTGKKSQGKESPNPPPQQQQQQQHQQHPALRVRNERGDCLSSRPAPVTQPLAPTIHLNINLNSSSHLVPLLQQKGQDAIINLSSLHGYPHWSPASSEVSLASSHGYQQINPGKSSQMSRKGVNAQLHHRKVECSTKHWQRAEAVLQWPLSSEGEEQKWSPNEFHSEQVPLNLPRTPTTSTASLGSGSYTVLPPIGMPVTGKEPELTPGQNVQTTYPIHRSSSDGYLVHMEKQKQLRTKVAYKAYSLKDYRLLKSDVKLRGLGPDYTAIDKTKMKRQKLYSNVIREQNKKISRIPFLLAKDPEGNDKKVPRIKALEYAKTIAKPSVQCQAKPSQKHQSEDFTEHAPCLKDLEVFQPSALEVLRKRHEEEKQAVARFTKVHPV